MITFLTVFTALHASKHPYPTAVLSVRIERNELISGKPATVGQCYILL